MPTLQALQQLGQSVWLDYIDRGLIDSGELRALVDDGVTGVTSNPTIFDKAISNGTHYDAAIERVPSQTSPDETATTLMIEDIRDAADLLAQVYQASGGDDGFVSLEVSPALAHDAGHTVDAARYLWREAARANVMIKVPGTEAGLIAFETLIAEGINVNVTLLFSLRRYRHVVEAYLRGVTANPDPSAVRSVASFFVSRVDAKFDAALEAIGSEEALALRGKAAVANAVLAYKHFRAVFDGAEFERQRQRGARLQRLLWASTSTKNPAYSDVLYVDSLIGADTVNTMAPATLRAWQNHGVAALRLDGDASEAQAVWDAIQRMNVAVDDLMHELEQEGIDAFYRSYQGLLASLKEKLAGRIQS